MRRYVQPILILALALAAGCSTIDQILGRGGSNAHKLELRSLTITSDHPLVATSAAGPAQAAVGTTVRFTCTGGFVDLDNHDSPVTEDLTSAVLWTSTVPSIAFPGSDGRAFVNSAGTTTVTAHTPAVGTTIQEQTSNSITLTAP
jgi:hypothetical protein